LLCDHALQFLESFNNIARKKRSFKTGKDVWLREEKLVEKMKAYALHLLQVSEQKHWWQD
jgi:hypothetical protein